MPPFSISSPAKAFFKRHREPSPGVGLPRLRDNFSITSSTETSVRNYRDHNAVVNAQSLKDV